MSKKIKIMIADDHALVRDGLVSVLQGEKNLVILGVAKNGKELIEQIRIKEPDIVTLDIEMPVMNGIEALAIIKNEWPEIKVIMVSMYADTYHLFKASALGADAFISKDQPGFDLCEVINELIKGRAIKRKPIGEMEPPINSFDFADQKMLDEMEVKVLIGICEGLTNKQIAGKLNISTHTVDYYKRNIKSKTGHGVIATQVLYAVRHGFFSVSIKGKITK